MACERCSSGLGDITELPQRSVTPVNPSKPQYKTPLIALDIVVLAHKRHYCDKHRSQLYYLFREERQRDLNTLADIVTHECTSIDADHRIAVQERYAKWFQKLICVVDRGLKGENIRHVMSVINDLRLDQVDLERQLGTMIEMNDQQVPPKIDKQGKGNNKQSTRSLKDRFSFNPGQALFNGNDLNLPTGSPIDMLKKLVAQFDKVVPYTEFDKHYSSAMPGTVHKDKKTILTQLEQHKVPCEITAKTGEGYVLRPKSLQKRSKKRVRK